MAIPWEERGGDIWKRLEVDLRLREDLRFVVSCDLVFSEMHSGSVFISLTIFDTTFESFAVSFNENVSGL